MVTYYFSQNDIIWKALSDGRRRLIVEALVPGPKRTSDLVALFPDIGRTGVLKHIDILTQSGVVYMRREGRTRWNHLNTKPIETVCSAWVNQHIDGLKLSTAKLKAIAERGVEE